MSTEVTDPPASSSPPPPPPPPPPPREPEDGGRKALRDIVHSWIPLGIVLVSVLAALMGWRASLSDEHSAHAEELSRQDLVAQQQLIVQDNQAIDADVQTFGQFAQYSALAHSLQQDSGKVTGAVGAQMVIEAQADLGIARYLGRQIVYNDFTFDSSNPTGNPALREDGTYQPGHPYKADVALQRAENADTALHGLDPEKLHETAESEHTHGVDFTGIAALFVGVMVLLTLAAVITGPPKVYLAGSGLTLAIVGLILFATVQFTS